VLLKCSNKNLLERYRVTRADFGTYSAAVTFFYVPHGRFLLLVEVNGLDRTIFDGLQGPCTEAGSILE
jgi:hypothetical protein